MSTLCEALIDDVAAGTRESWLSWRALLTLPQTSSYCRRASGKCAQFRPCAGGRAAFDLRFVACDALVGDPGMLLEILKLRDLRDSPSERTSTGSDLRFAGVDEALMSTQVKVAEALLGQVAAAAGLVAELAVGAPSGLQGQLVELPQQRGFAAEATMVRDASKARAGVWLQRFLQDVDAMKDIHVAGMLAESAPAQLSRTQATSSMNSPTSLRPST